MSRNIRTEAIVLKTGRVGEIHKSVTLLTPNLGIIDTIAHGVYKGKGKLASATDPFALSVAYLYFEPVKKNYKITDMECVDLFDGLRADLRCYYAASLWAEIIIRSHGGGEGSDRVFELMKRALGLLSSGADERCVQIQFLWRFISLSGFLPDIASCAICGRDFEEREPVVYRRTEGDFACEDCMEDPSLEAPPDRPLLGAGARRYLIYTEGLDFEEALKIELVQRGKEQLLTLMYQFVQDILEVPLKTLQAGVL
jgi:DNA repair protein RecO (recombination protein O)